MIGPPSLFYNFGEAEGGFLKKRVVLSPSTMVRMKGYEEESLSKLSADTLWLYCQPKGDFEKKSLSIPLFSRAKFEARNPKY